MAKSFKQLILNIARLNKGDQKWLINRLSPEQKAQFEALDGRQLLQQAKKFRQVEMPANLPVTAVEPLPPYCNSLADNPPLFCAIILEQGNFPWIEHFLQAHDPEQAILDCLQTRIVAIKPDTKKALFAHWQKSNTFEQFLAGQNHG
ncbi:hypothetical protein ACFORL_10435 [Legionella dresdenensis]|uniref:DNA polymerase III subunit chi n=1 Tax=Legionella dresdenensis TaxID=450200 RepID=A0ABV8CHL7_9GAMM